MQGPDLSCVDSASVNTTGIPANTLVCIHYTLGNRIHGHSVKPMGDVHAHIGEHAGVVPAPHL